MFNIKEELKKLPAKPGVYIMKDKEDDILYVGKAVSLKNRVRQYFMKTNKTARIQKMVSLIDHFEYVVTDNEVEALLLECNLIKQNSPKFNVLLKDDKTYPYIKINIKEDFPNIYITRTLKNDGAKYFGPYANVYAAKLDEDYKIIIDSEDYRMRHEEYIVRNAFKNAEYVRKTGKSKLLEPMNPFERRLIHTALNDFNGVETKSEGDGLYKQVRIIPVKNK